MTSHRSTGRDDDVVNDDENDGATPHEEQAVHDDVELPVVGAFRSHADQRRLAQVQAAKRERDAARHDDVTAGLGVTAVPSPSDADADAVRPAASHPTQEVSPRDASLDLGAASTPSSPSRDGGANDALGGGVPEPRGADDVLRILVVCTGNVCRSPYFERVLAADLTGLPVVVEGAGTDALLIERMATGSQTLLRERGLDPSSYRPRQLTAHMLRRADLVLAASREHRRIVVDEAPAAAARVFALLDFADACQSAVLADHHGIDGFRDLVREARAGVIERHSERSEDDAAVIDPFRQSQDVFVRMAAQADPALATVAHTIRQILG